MSRYDVDTLLREERRASRNSARMLGVLEVVGVIAGTIAFGFVCVYVLGIDR